MSDIYYTSDGSIVTLEDHDGDGYEETTLVDENRDGETDAWLIDTDGDTHDDQAYFDNSPGDDRFTADVTAIDTDSDGRVDRVYDDLDFDGDHDRVTTGDNAWLADANPYGPNLQETVNEVYRQL